MPNRRPTDPYGNFRFAIEMDGVVQAAFMQCSGLEASIDVVEVRHGSDRVGGSRKLPGRVRYANLVLRRGFTASDDLWNWFKAAADGAVQRRNGVVIVYDEERNEAARYLFLDAWPCRWKSLELDAGASAPLIEEIEIAVERIERG